MRTAGTALHTQISRWPVQLVLLTLALIAVFGPAFVPDTTFAGMDFVNLLYPHAVVAQRAFAGGSIPLWNWYHWSGSPFLAPMQAAVLYPPTWPALLLPLPFGLQLSVLAHLILAGWGAFRLAGRHFGVTGSSASYAAVAYSASGFLFGHLEQLNSVAAIAWTPWIFSTALSAAATGGRFLPFILFCTLAMLAGHPQYLALTIIFLGIFLLARVGIARLVGSAGDSNPVIPLRLLLLAGALSVAAALAAAQLFSTRELGHLSERVWPYPDPHEPALRGALLPALLVPRYYNQLAETAGRPLGYTELGLYTGLLTVPLFLIGVVDVLRRRSAGGLALLVTWAASLYYAFGSIELAGLEIGLAPAVLKLVPFLAQSRGSARSLNIETLAFAVLAARGLSVLGAGTFLSARARTILPLSITGILVADLALTHRPELLSRLIPAETLTDALPPSLRSQLWPETSGTGSTPERLYRLMARDSDYYLDDRQAAVAQRRLRLQPNLNAVEQIPTLDGYEEGLLPTRSYANFLRRYNRNLRSDSPDAALLALMGSHTMLTEYPVRATEGAWQPKGRPVPSPTGPLQQWLSPYPTAWFLDRATLDAAAEVGGDRRAGHSDADHEFAALAEPGAFSPLRDPLGQERLAHAYSGLSASDFKTAAARTPLQVTTISPNSLGLVSNSAAHASARTPRELLFLQAPYPGWKLRYVKIGETGLSTKAELQLKRSSPVFSTFIWPPANADLSAGAVLAFSPYSFRLGLFVTLATAALIAVLLLRRFGVRRNSDLHSGESTPQNDRSLPP